MKKMASNVDVIGDITSMNGWVISINYMQATQVPTQLIQFVMGNKNLETLL